MIDPVTAQLISSGVKEAADAPFKLANMLFQQGEQKKAREFQQSYSLLSNQQQNEINRLYLNAQTGTDRMAVLNMALAQIQTARVGNSGKNQNTVLIPVAIVAVVLRIAVYGINFNK